MRFQLSDETASPCWNLLTFAQAAANLLIAILEQISAPEQGRKTPEGQA